MILTDFSAVAISALVHSAIKEKQTLDENVVKHITFSTFRNIHKKLGNKFGEHLLLCDDRSWRKDEFEYYKANRSNKDDDDGPIDWQLIFRQMEEIKEAFDKHFPFHVIQQKGAEADDLIAIFAKQAKENVCIVSRDHDFFQLQRYPHVVQYSSIDKRFLKTEDPIDFRIRHIIGGDSGDGVPNILSDDDTFVNPYKRQARMTEKRLAECLEWAKNNFIDAPEKYIIAKKTKKAPEKYCNIKKNWARNKNMVDLINLKPWLQESVDKYYTQDKKKVTKNDTANYLASKKMIGLMGKISDFYIGQKQPTGPLSNFM